MPKIDINGTTPSVSLARAYAAIAVPVGKSLSRDEIADAMGARAGTGAANNRVIAARRFGLLMRESNGKYSLTPLGKRLSQSGESAEILIEAIRKVPIFKALLDLHPQDVSTVGDDQLIQDAVKLGASAEVAARIVRLLKTSLAFASRDEPTPLAPTQNASSANEGAISPAEGGVRADDDVVEASVPAQADRTKLGSLAMHPLIEPLMLQAPPPGSDWGKDARTDWITALDAMLALIYPPRRRD